jgi:hypothetical protein
MTARSRSPRVPFVSGLEGRTKQRHATHRLSANSAKIPKLVYERVETRSLRAAYLALGLNEGRFESRPRVRVRPLTDTPHWS